MRVLPILIYLMILCYASYSQTSTDIYLLDIGISGDKIEVLDYKNITDREGYDNQPAFDDRGHIYYVSIREQQSDIYLYDISSASAKQITFTAESEYSPTPLREGTFSAVRVDLEGKQQLWKLRAYPFRTEKILNHISGIGYHSWINDSDIALFIVGEPHSLHLAEIGTEKNRRIYKHIGSAIHKVPERNAVAFMDFTDSLDCSIKIYDLKLHQTEDICPCMPDSEYFIYLDKDRLLSIKGTELMIYTISAARWTRAADLSHITDADFYRLSINSEKTQLALVARRAD